ncbi:hypothetical protein [Nitrosomonas eutropha]|uniref:hypothetical protein n=1 Tax=Nitrosomonas eutropha TaxID=916 RepID=UPI0008B00ADC|nr:hypothetical protein [Nitrosomonas eutropha]SEJ07430.1 hypothetical protein SAMN05216318_12317 [Nitrosomonas eutropha]
MRNKAIPSKQVSNSFYLDKAEFDRVLKRIEQGCSTIYDARFIRKFIAGINQEIVDGRLHS